MNVFDSIPEELSIYELFKQHADNRNYTLVFNSEKKIVLRQQFTLIEGQYFLKIKVENTNICLYTYSVDIQLVSHVYSAKLSWQSNIHYDTIHFPAMVQKLHKQIAKTIPELEAGNYRPKGI